MKRTIIGTTAALALGASSLFLPSIATPASAGPKTAPTRFVLGASGYGSRVGGGDAPASSGRSAFQILGCTNRAGLSKQNTEATERLPDMGRLSGLKTRVWTTEHDGVVSSWSRHHIDRATFTQNATGKLVLKAIESTSRAFHSASGYHATTASSVGSIVFRPTDGAPQTFPVPAPEQDVRVPGVATIEVGSGTQRTGAGVAYAAANALRVVMKPTNSKVVLAYSRANIEPGVRSGLFSGSAYGSKARSVDGKVTSGMTPFLVMPCLGTDGKIRRSSIATVHIAGVGRADGLATSEWSQQTAGTAEAWERAKVQKIRFGGGKVLIRGVLGRSHLVTTGSALARDVRGTTPGKVFVNGQRRRFPDSGPMTIPGVAKLTPRVVTLGRSSIQVVALHVKLLDGSGTLLDLGQARVHVERSGL